MADFKSFAALADAMRRRASDAALAMDEATREHTTAIYARGKEIMNRDIYSVPIDTTKFSYRRTMKYGTRVGKNGKIIAGFVLGRDGKRVKYALTEKAAARARRGGMAAEAGRGKPKWRRTGNLHNAESMYIAAGAGYIVNTMAYAQPRHDLGLSEGSQDAVVGSRRRSQRVAPWRRQAVREQEPNRIGRYRTRLFRALSRG